MTLRRIFAAFLALALVIGVSPFSAVRAAEDTVISAPDTNYVLRSAAVKHTAGAGFLERDDTTGIYADDPLIDTLLTQAPGEFNKAGEEWVWIAYKVSAPANGTYTLGVTTNSCKWADFKIPMVVNHEVYTLTYTAKAQTQTVEVPLPAGEHVVTVFWPMPANASEVYVDADWNSYLWANIASVTADSALTVCSAPTAAEVEAAVKPNTVISAVDSNTVLWSAAMGDNGNGYLEFNNRDAVKADKPYIESLPEAAIGEFNKSGEEWGWLAYKVTAPSNGNYTLKLQLQNCRNAPYFVPFYVNGKVYTFSYSATGRQSDAVEVALTKGAHTVVMFAPMPVNAEAAAGQDWVDYPWANPEQMTVDALLTVSKPSIAEVEACFAPAVKEDTVISAIDAGYMLWSAAVGDNGNGQLEFNARDAVKADLPHIDTLYTSAPGQFNKAGEEWGWFAYNVTATAAGTYTLSVNINGCRNAPYAIPLCVNGKAYTLSYTTNGKQSVSTEVELPAGTHTVIMFMPMPVDEAGTQGDLWVVYPWCNVGSVTVDGELKVSKPTVAEVEACFPVPVKEDAVISAVDTDKLLLSATIKQNPAALGRTDQATLKVDQPTIKTLYADAPNQFNASGSEWNWFAYKVSVPEDGSYTLGVKTAGSKYASYQIPMCINGQVYALQYTAKAQAVTTEVTLPAGEHVVVVFMPMPAAKANITNNEWNDYHWCDVESVTVDGELTVSKPTVAEVEAVFAPITISAVDTNKILLSATIKQNAAALGRTDQATLKVDQPTIETLYTDAFGQFNKSGEEWNWFAYKVSVPEDGSYTLGVKTVGSKSASYQIPMCINGQVYALQYTAKAQAVTTEVTLPAGEHVVVVFMPMPAAKANITNNEWNDYHWCDVGGVIVPAGMQITKPTVAEVEACFPKPAEPSPLLDKSVLFVGDSITHSTESWASVIGNAYKMDWTNGGVNGATISDAKIKIIRHQLMANNDKSYDYVIMQGGINDAMAETPIGTVSSSWNVADFDAETYIGGLETLFYYAYENFPGAKLGYIITYATPNSKFGGKTAGNDTKAYYEEAKKVCDKWGISYIDLYSGSTADGKSYSFDILQVDKNAANFINNDAQEIHLSAAGYALISPYLAKWMETLTEKTSPIPAANSGKHIDANDTGKVLFGGFTPKGNYVDGAAQVGLQDRVYTGMVADNATIELLPYAKDMLGDWAFASIAVDAAQDGAYTIRVEMAAKVAYQMGMLVDGKAYTLTYTKKDGYYEFMEQTVTLTKGTHYITFTAAMPNNDNELDGDAWNLYPWTNIAAVVVDEGLEVLSKPALTDVTAKLSAYESLYTRVEAEDTDYVIYNNYNTTNEANSKASGGMLVGGAWNSTYEQTFEELAQWMDIKHNAYVEYAVVAPADGEYDIRVGFLAGSNDKSVAKPYIAVVVNGTTHKVQFTKDWNQIDKAKLTVSLKKGLNIIRCTSITTEQAVYGVKGWVNQDFLDLDTRLTPVKHSSVTLEAEKAKYYNKLIVQNGGEGEEASGKVLGKSDRRYVSGLKLTLDQLTDSNLRQVPYFSVTVNAPMDGYYPIRLGMSSDGRLPRATIGMIVDGVMHVVPYARINKTTAGGSVDTLVYLTAGEHVITFTTPMPATADPEANYSYYWSNYDYIELYDGLEFAQKQKAPTSELKYVRIEVEEYAMFNLNKNNGTAAGNAYYRSSQSIAEMLENGIDGSRTPYVELTVQADKAGPYVLYLGIAAGMTEGSTVKEIDAQFVVQINDTVRTKWAYAPKSTNYTIIPLWVTLKEGTNTIRLTHLSSDAHYGGTTWIDFDYIEMPYWETEQIAFVKSSGEILEAENAKYDGFGESTSSAYSGGRYLGRANYDTVAEVNLTYETLDPANLNGLPHVTYRVFAEKAGTYAVAVGFAAGLTNYTTEETKAGVDASLVAIVNGQTKQRVAFRLCSPSANMTRLILLELQEGENEVTFTGTTTEYVVDRIPRNDETYRLVWIDQDYLLLGAGLSNMGQDVDPFDIEDSGYDFGQLVPRDPSQAPTEQEQPNGNPPAPQPEMPAILWILIGIGVAAILFFVILIGKKRKKNEEKQ